MSADHFAENSYNRDFWFEIEKNIGEKIPEIVKFVLAKCGYEILFCLENLSSADIDDIESHARLHLKDKLEQWLKNDNEYEHSNSSEFTFLPGHRKIIALIPQKISAAKVSELASNPAAEVNDQIASKNSNIGNCSISPAQDVALKSELCKSIRTWMVGKGFHESVSISTCRSIMYLGCTKITMSWNFRCSS